MLKIGLISDTHSYLDPAVFEHFKDMDEIWHMGDIGEMRVYDELAAFKPTRAVWGNIETLDARHTLPEILDFSVEGIKILMIHIGAIPPNYNTTIKNLLKKHEPNLFLCGHSHILRVLKDKQHQNLVYINPGAAGKHGFHHIRTIMRMHLHEGKVSQLEVVELGKR